MEYSINYLKSLIENKVEENLNLDYKSALALDKQPSKTVEISKDISAFANSDGGVIIYGIREDNEQKHLPKELDPIKRKDFSKEWLEQIINDKIRPRIENLKIHPIAVTDEEVVYVVEISKSNTAHQADDKRYYKRFNFQSVSMYDYEIRDILNRKANPIVYLDFEYIMRGNKLIVNAVNSGTVLAKYLNVIIRASEAAVIDENFKSTYDGLYEFSAENTVRDVIDVEIGILGSPPKYTYGPSRYKPILPTRTFKLKELFLKDYAYDNENILEWEIYCDSAPPVIGSKRFYEIMKR